MGETAFQATHKPHKNAPFQRNTFVLSVQISSQSASQPASQPVDKSPLRNLSWSAKPLLLLIWINNSLKNSQFGSHAYPEAWLASFSPALPSHAVSISQSLLPHRFPYCQESPPQRQDVLPCVLRQTARSLSIPESEELTRKKIASGSVTLWKEVTLHVTECPHPAQGQPWSSCFSQTLLLTGKNPLSHKR